MRHLAGLLLAFALAAPAAGQGGGPCSLAPCHRLDGNDWVRAWRGAAAVGDEGVQAEALRWLDSLAFWPPPVAALARWTLGSAPWGAVLLAQGDGDALPMLGLQLTEGLRPDVAVVHHDLLGDARYAAHVAERAGLPFPDPLSEVGPNVRREGLVAEWTAGALAGTTRPLVGALTLDPAVLGRHAAVVVSAGAYQAAGDGDAPPFRLAAAEAAAGRVRGRDFVGPRTSPTDRDSVRLASPVDLGGIVLFQLLQTAVSHAQAGDGPAAERAYARAVAFASEAEIADDPLVAIARQWIDEALAGSPAEHAR